jgi:methionyl-tRNA formyltransferase
VKVILCGYHWCGCKALKYLLDRNHEVFVYTHKNEWHIPSLMNYCKKTKTPCSTQSITHSDLPFVPDVICSVYYRNIIGEKVINACDGKIFNLHPSLLPKYRGCSSLTWAMVNGEQEAGFTYHYIDKGCDTGPILISKSVAIEEWDTQQTLYQRVMFEGISYFPDALDMVISGECGAPQGGESSSYPRQCPFNGEINSDWSEDDVERFIRAMIYPPYPPAKFAGCDVHTMEQYKELVSSHENQLCE